MLNKKCKFLTKDSLCAVYEKRPNVCQKWFCGPGKKDTKI